MKFRRMSDCLLSGFYTMIVYRTGCFWITTSIISVAAKCDITLNIFSPSSISSFNWQKGGKFKSKILHFRTPLSYKTTCLILCIFPELHNGQDVLTKLIWEIKNHPEGFLDSERCLKCVDAGKRNEVLKNLKMLKQGKISEPGIWIYQPMYSAVLDKLNYLLGHYHALK